ncbi:aspartyl-phosphate phosphatase Spo0E family protein [Paenibacillus kribbensis]|uniref:aspartyl-phosphate phosphatase Spo0E family protein n=1 Tax=Paenibacillus kribbensis TaxID=172713 RepID=UPI00159F06D7|nr:aspartyl-phosphate phosphatase Spo0E family protein [Paenibacillus kribbensis]
MVDLKGLQERIERERRELNKLAEQYGILDWRTLGKSQEIDLMVNDYNKQTQNKKPTA